MKIELSNSIVNISKDATIVCNFDNKFIEIMDTTRAFTIYPASIEKMKQDFAEIKTKLKG